MDKVSRVELCVSDFEQSIQWFENVLGFRVIAREEDEYAELARGETTIQLATDSAPYWASERPHLLPPGQRGSGVEIVLLVDNVEAVYRQAQQAGADIARPIADYPWHMRQFWVRHPDGYLIRPAQRILSVNPATYRRQVAEAFEEDTTPIAQKLLPMKKTADNLVEQQDYLGAATIYEALVQEIFKHSHLHIDEEAEYDDYYEEEGYYPEEEGLDKLVEQCIAALGNSLADERADKVAREKIIQVLFDIYVQDLHASGEHDFASRAAEQLVRYARPLERPTIAEWIQDALDDEEEEVSDFQRRAYGRFLLDLEKDTLDEEAYLRICHETGRISDLIDRLLALGRVDEAVKEIQHADSYAFLSLIDLFMRHGQDAVAERLVKERNNQKPDVAALQWLQKYYQAKGNLVAELEITENLFRTQPYLGRYKELHNLASQLGRWETLRPQLLATLKQNGQTTLLIEIALDEGDIDKALQLLKESAKKDSYGYTYPNSYGYYGYHGISLVVAAAAEETRPREALELYRQYAERLIAMRGRQNYQQATNYLKNVRALYQKLGESEAWITYITTLREQNRSLRALKEELANAGL
jgi:catechol 2,3-dioxygenase-like lactoylglutathione lyase family enzyme